MIEFVDGDLFNVPADAIGHGVNCQGVMGAGIAKTFKEKFPSMFEGYVYLCRSGALRPGLVFTYYDEGKAIYNMATQDFPGPGARLNWVVQCLKAVRLDAEAEGYNTVALPRIAAGIGGLDWEDVKSTMIDILEPSTVQFTIVTYKE